jgi:rhodanese-related sulfurtransferase
LVVSLSEKEFFEKASSGKALLVDVRTAEEIASGKIPSAISIDFYRADFQDEILKLSKDQEILIYCSAGVRSLQASEFLAKNGYSKIYHLEGGLGNWVRKGYAFE